MRDYEAVIVASDTQGSTGQASLTATVWSRGDATAAVWRALMHRGNFSQFKMLNTEWKRKMLVKISGSSAAGVPSMRVV